MSRFRYYFERTVAWMLNNKIIVLLSLLSFCLFVSTLAIAGQRNRLSDELEELRKSLTTTPEITTVVTENETVAEVTEPPAEKTTTESSTTDTATESSTTETATESSTTETATESSTTDVSTTEEVPPEGGDGGGDDGDGNKNDNRRNDEFQDNDNNRNEQTVVPMPSSDNELYGFDSKMMKVLGFSA